MNFSNNSIIVVLSCPEIKRSAVGTQQWAEYDIKAKHQC
jgi:hypothetical protein